MDSESTNPLPFENFSGNLRSKVAIVTGASRGIGAGIAFELARRAGTYTSQSSEKVMDALIEKIDGLGNGSQAIKIKADLRDPSVPKQVVEQAVEAFGANIDILVNNAGAELVKPLQDITVEEFDSIYHLNVRAPMRMVQAALPYLRAPGRIINIGSVGARYGFKNLSVYCSSKAALEGFTRCWAAELGAAGHTVNSVNPGPVQTQLMENIPKDYIEMQKSQTPVENRIGTVDDVAQVVAWLASEESRWITGQVLSASGGWAMY
ncbi:NAD(P)-binding protein [Parathielavia appendiculata]|uniref:NAD(P)-binding protein n=1 Tax=Parathielavia appendiculata TaxID=2587402 RepID=A0AAN6Z732_9PEZI|nr:NAD(P)-binding protein [Parathielavia appendiculata]